MSVALAVIAKAPVAGRVKTRLCPPCTPAQAALLATAALTDTLAAIAATPAPRRGLVLDGARGAWLPDGFDVIPQAGDGLDQRLAAAFAAVDAPLLLVGMDTPQLTAPLLAYAAGRLLAPGVDAVLGLTEDGGYWGIGLRRSTRALFEGVPMSRADTGARQLQRLREHGLTVDTGLPVLTDVDDITSARGVAAAHPTTAFARTLRGQALDRPPATRSARPLARAAR